MRPNAHHERIAARRGRGDKLPLALFHAPLPGEEVELFSDRTEDAIEREAIVHEFELRHDADCVE